MRVNERGYAVPTLATDAVLVDEAADEVLLIERGREPFAEAWALPGGFVEVGETIEDACRRELAEETGCQARLIGLIGVYSDPDRDPRGHVVSAPFLAVPEDPNACRPPSAGDDAASARWFPLDDPPEMAFDHGEVLADAVARFDLPGALARTRSD